jgi:hypothetical protein
VNRAVRSSVSAPSLPECAYNSFRKIGRDNGIAEASVHYGAYEQVHCELDINVRKKLSSFYAVRDHALDLSSAWFVETGLQSIAKCGISGSMTDHAGPNPGGQAGIFLLRNVAKDPDQVGAGVTRIAGRQFAIHAADRLKAQRFFG